MSPDAHVFAMNLVLVVQRSPGNGGAGHHHGVELGHRGENAGAAHLDGDGTQQRLLLLGRELVGRKEPRGPGRETQGVLSGKGVDLHHDAVDVIGQPVAASRGLFAEGMHLGGTGTQGDVGVHMEAGLPQPPQELPLGGGVGGVHVGQGVHKGGKVASGRHLGVLLAQRPRRGVAGVGKGGTARLVVLLVEPDEGSLGHIDLAAYLDAPVLGAHARERRRCQVARNVGDGKHVGRHVLAHDAVAARRGAHEHALLIGERDAQAVYFELAHIGRGLPQLAFHPVEPFVELGEVHNVVDGVHARRMADTGELVREIATHTLGVPVGGHQLGMGTSVDHTQLVHQGIEGGVAYHRGIEGIVLIGIAVKKPIQLGGALAGGLDRGLPGRGCGLGHGASSGRWQNGFLF